MNPEIPLQKVERPESMINISSVYFDNGLEGVFNKEKFIAEIQRIIKYIDKYLGENKNFYAYDLRIYSDRNEYENYFKVNFPDRLNDFMENDMVCYPDEKNNRVVIAKFMERTKIDPNDEKTQEYLKRAKLTIGELEAQSRQNYRNNIYPTLAHEITHTHSFFNGVDYRVPGNKWAQEMVCVFIDQKMWEKYIPNFKEIILSKAREQAQNMNFYNEIIADFSDGDFHTEDWERLFYPFLENRYGKEKLIKFWSGLFKDKADFEQCFEITFGENLKDVMSLFQKEILEEK